MLIVQINAKVRYFYLVLIITDNLRNTFLDKHSEIRLIDFDAIRKL